MFRAFPLIWLALLLFAAPTGRAAELPTRTLTIGKDKLITEVVVTPEQRATGLMNRFSLAPDHGMLFVFERPQPLGFWMKNTYIPLDMIFIGPSLKVVGVVENAEPQTTTLRTPGVPSQYVLEVNAGFTQAHGIAPGQRVKIDGI